MNKFLRFLYAILFICLALSPAFAAENQPLTTVKAVQKLLKKGVDLEAPRLIRATHFKYGFNSAYFFKEISPKDKDYVYCVTPLMETVLHGNREGAELLLKGGALVNSFCSLDHRYTGHETIDTENGIPAFRYTPLSAAALLNDLPMVELLLREKADPNFRVDKYHPCALEQAVKAEADLRIVELLVEAGADQQSRDQALRIATWLRRDEEIAYLLLSGANVNAYCPTVLSVYQTPFLTAVYLRDLARVKQFLAVGADPDQRNKRDPWLVRDLIDHRYIVHNGGSGGNTGYRIHDAYGYSETSGKGIGVDSLLAEYAREDPTLIYTPMQIAFLMLSVDKHIRPGGYPENDEKIAEEHKKAVEIIDALLAANASLNTAEGADSPLMTAAYYGSLGAVDRLLRAGADWTYANAKDDTIVEALINGASTYTKTRFKGGVYGDADYVLNNFTCPIVDRLIACGRTSDEKRKIALWIVARSNATIGRKGYYYHLAEDIRDYTLRRAENL